MKKIFLVLAAALCVATVSAQNKFESSVKNAAQAIASQQWSVGARLGSGFQAQAECFYGDKTYVEARFGMQWATSALTADFTVLHNWNVFNMDWTPSVGQWFFDAGCGLNVGGREHFAYIGVAGQAKLGIKFNNVPIRLAIDWTPSFGPGIVYFGGFTHTEFFKYGLCNLGLSATYCF